MAENILFPDIKEACDLLGYSLSRYRSIVNGLDESDIEDQLSMLYGRLSELDSYYSDREWDTDELASPRDETIPLREKVSTLCDKLRLPDSEYIELTSGADGDRLAEVITALEKRLKAAKLEASRKKGQITDVGEYLPGARKEDPAPVAGASPQTDASGSLPKLEDWWPMPDWAEMVESGQITAEGACYLHFFRKNLAKVPPYEFNAKGISREMWDMYYHQAVDCLKRIIPSVRTREDYEKARSTYNEMMGWSGGKHPSSGDNKLICPPYAVGRSSHRAMHHPWSLTQMAWFRSKSLHHMGWPTEPIVKDNAKFIICDFTKRGDSTTYWAVVQCVGSGVQRISELTANRDEAVEAALRKIEERGATRSAPEFVDVKRPAPPDGRVRIGPEWRDGDITPDTFMSVLGFRGIQFGEWLPQKERQESLNMAFDAFHDLADIFGLPVGSMSLKGTLGLAFGSRGRGFTSGAAHYETDQKIIHLTRLNGGGALAHEWAHAIDHSMGIGAKARFKTSDDHFTGIIMHNELDHATVSGNPSCGAMNNVVDTINRSDHYMDQAYRLSNWRDGGYWSRIHELFARAFEASVFDVLAGTGRRSDYLVYGVEQE